MPWERLRAEAETFAEKPLKIKEAILTGYLLSLVHPPERQRLFSSGDVDEDFTRNGILNPDACFLNKTGGKAIFRCEPEETTWGGHFLQDKAVPMLGDFRIKDGKMEITKEPIPLRGGQIMSMRAEDWRLFKGLDGRLYTNFTNYFFYNEGFPQTETRCTTCVARINGERLELIQELSALNYGRENQEEKNWLLFTHRNKYICIYSVDPYLAFEMDRNFEICAIAATRKEPLPRICSNFMANGTNPIPMSNDVFGNHYIMVCHNFTHARGNNKRNRTYWHYALVLDFETLEPIGFSPFPILGGGGWSGRHNNIMYISGMLSHGKDFFFLYGEGDEHSEVCRLPKEIVYQNILPL